MDRQWFTVSDKVSKKDMDKVDISKYKNDSICVSKYREIYGGGENDQFEGFYNSDEDVDFENFKKGKKASQGGGLFSKLTSAF